MGQFLHGLPSAVVGVATIFSWVPLVWLAFKLISWQRDAVDKQVQEYIAEQKRIIRCRVCQHKRRHTPGAEAPLCRRLMMPRLKPWLT